MAGVEPLELVSRFVDIMAAINEEAGIKITEIAHATGISRGAVNRFVISIEEMGYIRRDDRTKGYWPTSKTLELSCGLSHRAEVRASVLPYLAAACRDVGWPVNFSTISNSQLALIAHTDDISPLAGKPRQPDLFRPLVGRAAGHVLLAGQSEDVRKDILAVALTDNRGLYTDAAISPADLERILQDVAKQGYGTWTVEPAKRASIAVPVTGSDTIKYSVSVGFDADAMTVDEAVAHCLSALQTCAADISQRLQNG